MTPRKKRICTLAALALAVVVAVPAYVRYTVRNSIFTDVAKVEAKEFAIVLGAAIENNSQPGSYLKYRLNDAVTLFNAGCVEKILLSGDNSKESHDEISVMNNYLLEKGIPQSKIYGDYAGFDTYSTMERASKLFDIKSAVVVSQAFHLPRAVYIARQKGIAATGYATRASYGKIRYFFRENLAILKSYIDCLIGRKAKFYGEKIDTNKKSNIILEQL